MSEQQPQNTRKVTLEDLIDTVEDLYPLAQDICLAAQKAHQQNKALATPQAIASILGYHAGNMIYYSHPDVAVQESMLKMALTAAEITVRTMDVLPMPKHPYANATMTDIVRNCKPDTSPKALKKNAQVGQDSIELIVKIIDGEEAGLDKATGRLNLKSSPERIAIACTVAMATVIGATVEKDKQSEMIERGKRFIAHGLMLTGSINRQQSEGAQNA